MKKGITISVLIFFSFHLHVSENHHFKQEYSVLHTASGDIYGTLFTPKEESLSPVAILISGSGPTDRNGNQPGLQNNSLKMLAEALVSHGISSLRYDKRAIGKSKIKNLSEFDLRFEHYVEDVTAWVKWLKEKNKFKEITIIGHSEGSLIGMLASQKGDVDKFISLAGAGRSADKLLKEQLGNKFIVSYFAFPLIDDLVQGETVKAPFFLKTLLRDSVQPYLTSWFKYDPADEISKLNIPILVVQGTADIQVKVEDAERLLRANEEVEIKIIPGMNHILKNSKLDRKENMLTYNQPNLPINEELIGTLVAFFEQ